MVAAPTPNIIHRTFGIGYSDKPGSRKFGTAFTLDVEDRQYLITAKHVVGQHFAAHDTLAGKHPLHQGPHAQLAGDGQGLV